MEVSYHGTPQECAESLRHVLIRIEAVTTHISGPCGAGKTTALAHIVRMSCETGIPLSQTAVFASTGSALRHLCALIGDEPDRLFSKERVGVPLDAMRRHSVLVGKDRALHTNEVAAGYLDILARLNDISEPVTDSDRRFLDSLKPRLLAALRADHECRLGGLAWPRNAYLDSVRDYTADYKTLQRLHDKADFVHADYYVSRQVRLLILDEILRSSQIKPHLLSVGHAL